MGILITIVWAYILLKILDVLGVKEDRRPGARSGQLRARYALRRQFGRKRIR